MLAAKLDANPCPLAFRLNYLALLYNGPLYDWVRAEYGLSRPEYVALYSLALSEGGSSRDISLTSGFPKNTLSRAIARLETLGLLARRGRAPGGGKAQPLSLSPAGWRLFHATRPAFEAQEQRMVESLTPVEQRTLSDLLSKIVREADTWAGTLPSEARTPKELT